MRHTYFTYLFVLSVAVTFLISGCSNQPVQTQTDTHQAKPKRIEKKPVSRLPSSAQIKQVLNERPLDSEHLLELVHQFVVAEDYVNANALLYALAPILPSEYLSLIHI